jgi:hypothetical protein
MEGKGQRGLSIWVSLFSISEAYGVFFQERKRSSSQRMPYGGPPDLRLLLRSDNIVDPAPT